MRYGGKCGVSSRDEVDAVLCALKGGFEAGRLAHAYLVVGAPRGNAQRLAEQVLCLLCCVSTGDRPCGECAGCRHVMKRTHPDMIWVEPQKKSRTIQKEQIQFVQQHVFRTSFEGGWKAVVLVNAERMNDVASNKLLKMLEEPPPATLFLLLTNAPESLLPTVVSRCQRLVLSETQDHRLPAGLPAEALAKAGALATVLRRSASPRREEGVSSEAGDARFRSAVVDIMTAVPGSGVVVGMARARLIVDLLKDVKKQTEASEKEIACAENPDMEFQDDAKDVLAARVEARYREARDSVLRCLLYWHRDMLLCVCGVEESTFYFSEESARIREVSAGLTCRQALDNIRQVEDMKSQLEQHLAEPMVFERGMTCLRAGNAEEEKANNVSIA
ncbi:ATP-binding protein [Verrucomicrobiota bacterium]